MNRYKVFQGNIIPLILLLLIGVLFSVSCSAADEATPEPDAENGSETSDNEAGENEETTGEETSSELPTLPVLEGSGQASGLGGGGGANPRPLGGGGGAAVAETASLEIADTSFIFTDPFSGTVFTLNSELPSAPGLAPVLQNVPSEAMSLEEVRELANKFGFSGQIYREQYPVYESEDGFPAYEPPVVYHLFDGQRTLIIDPWGVYYSDSSIENDYENPISFETAVPIAEAFVQERGLLNFEYEVMQIWGSDVNFVRTIDGQPTNQPEMTVGVSHDGRIYFASYQVLRNAEIIGRYPLISAQEAWDILQSGVVENNIPYQYAAQPELAIEEPAFIEAPGADLYQFWAREFAPGDEIHLYEWPIVYVPADGNGDPRIQIRGFIIQADAATLTALTERVGEQTHIWGQVNGDGTTLELTGWEPIEQFLEPATTGQGVISRTGELVLFTDANTGNIFIVPDAPADLEDGTEVYLFAWAARDLGQEYPVLDWESIDKIVIFPTDDEILLEEPIVEEPVFIDEPFEPFTYESFTVNEVSLAYYTTYSWPADDGGEVRYDGQPTIIVQPTWKFSGETDSGDMVEFFVQAPQPEYLNR